MKRMKKYGGVLAAAGAIALLIVLFPMLNAHATPETLIFWEDTSEKNEVLVSLSLPSKASLEEACTLELTFHLEGQEMESVAFLFDEKIVKDTGISVREFRYNEDTNDLKVFLSGRGSLIKKGEKLTLGRIRVVSENDLKISVTEDQCNMVDQYHGMECMAGLGEISVYEMKMKEETTTESSEEETIKPDVTEPDVTEPDVTEPDVTEPDVTEPDVTEPDVTEPDVTEPDVTEPDVTKPDITVPGTEEEDSDAEDEQESSVPNKNWISSGSTWQFKKPDGTLAKNEWAMVNGKWYRFNEKGNMQTGWILSNGFWYYLNPTGEMQTGWIFDGSKWYFCGASGAMQTGWIQVKTVWYHLQPSGAMDTGWLLDNGKWYYMGADGRMLANTVTEDGYHLDRNGVCVEK